MLPNCQSKPKNQGIFPLFGGANITYTLMKKNNFLQNKANLKELGA